MRGERIKCPSCHENLPNAERFGGTIAFPQNRGTATMNHGTLHCPCGANLVIVAGATVGWAPATPKPKVVSMEVVKEGDTEI